MDSGKPWPLRLSALPFALGINNELQKTTALSMVCVRADQDCLFDGRDFSDFLILQSHIFEYSKVGCADDEVQ